MTFAQVERAERRMQQQWHDLAMAEQAGELPEVLEQMYDRYIQLAEAYNACLAEYQHQRQNRRAHRPVPRPPAVVPRQDESRKKRKAS